MQINEYPRNRLFSKFHKSYRLGSYSQVTVLIAQYGREHRHPSEGHALKKPFCPIGVQYSPLVADICTVPFTS